MKKILFATLGIILFGVCALGQITKSARTMRSFVALTAGPAFPFGDFGSKATNNGDAGMAKVGFNIDGKFGHNFTDIFGLALNAEYARYAVDKAIGAGSTSVSTDPWQYYLVVAGPTATGTLTQRTSVDFGVLSGLAFVNSPKVMYNTEGSSVATKDDWVTTVPLKLSADFRFKFTTSGYLFAGANYQYMHPHFKTYVNSEYITFKRKMNVIGVNVGIGMGF